MGVANVQVRGHREWSKVGGSGAEETAEKTY